MSHQNTDYAIAQVIRDAGFRIADAVMQPTDIVEGVLRLVRGKERRVLHLERMTAKEATLRLIEVRNEGWVPAGWARMGPEKPITHKLGLRRSLA